MGEDTAVGDSDKGHATPSRMCLILSVLFLDKDMGDMLEPVLSTKGKLCSHAIDINNNSTQKAITSDPIMFVLLQ